MNLRNWWIRFGCFLTGHNYAIVHNSSEVAAKSVKRYTSAMLIVCILWSFVGYTFTKRYLEGSVLACIAGAVIAVVIIVQIERQIILSMHPSKGLFIFRGCLALMMSILGAVIIDQIILKQDIELEKISYVTEKVDALLPSKTKELKDQIFSTDSTIIAKETERQQLIDDISRQPVIQTISTQTQTIPVPVTTTDENGKTTTTVQMRPSTTVLKSNTPNPKQALLAPLDSTISKMRQEKGVLDAKLLNIRPALESEIKEKVGFLDELKVMHRLISSSGVALAFWLLWLFFLLFIEMLVLFSKMGDKTNDYDKTVMHQMDLQNKKLDVLAALAQKSSKSSSASVQ